MKIITPLTDEEWDMYYVLRYEILRKPWDQPFDTTFDEWETNSVHALMLNDDGKPVATGRLQINSEDEGQVRSMAVINSGQGKGLGTQMLRWLEAEAGHRRMSHIVLDARDDAVNFYKRNGYLVESDSYILFNTIVHYRMKKVIRSLASPNPELQTPD